LALAGPVDLSPPLGCRFELTGQSGAAGLLVGAWAGDCERAGAAPWQAVVPGCAGGPGSREPPKGSCGAVLC